MIAFPLIYIIYELVMLLFFYNYDTPFYVYNKYGEAEAKLELFFIFIFNYRKILDKIFMPEKAEIEL